MIRIICSNTDYADAANVGGHVSVTYKTFDVDLPAVEAWINEQVQWSSRSFIGIECLPDDAGKETK